MPKWVPGFRNRRASNAELDGTRLAAFDPTPRPQHVQKALLRSFTNSSLVSMTAGAERPKDPE